ncbi:DNA repair and recombination protein RadB [Candidatus Woesearchaeota archaeon]|nr:DNA repair and recombination protein RadB [Candidatus Woesearchaeota archaeon]
MKVSTGTKLLDGLLEGGYEADAITTVYGPPGSGKTNIGMLAALQAAKNGKKVIYIDTEGGFSTDRVKQILPDFKKALDNIIFLKPTSFEEQNKAIAQLKELATDKIGLIVIDTISMLYRLQRSYKEDDTHNKDLYNQILLLNEIARTKKIPILMLSQIYTSFDNGKAKIVGGDVISYTSKCLLELENLNNKRRVTLKKHRSLPIRQALFRIMEKGIIEEP